MAYYAVKIGKKPGIYETWSDCQKNISGFSGAKFHKFNTYEEAEEYMNKEEYKMNHYDGSDKFKIKYPCAFVDGSYNGNKALVGSGIYLKRNKDSDEIKIKKSYEANEGTEAKISRNIYGEIKACQLAVSYAMRLNFNEINIYYDYIGIEMFANKQWNIGKEKKFITDYIDNIETARAMGLKINFYKVPAHTGVKENERADVLAKRAAVFE